MFIDGLNDLAHEDDNPAHTKELTKFMDEGEISPFKKLHPADAHSKADI